MTTDTIDELGELPETIEDINKDPILKPLLDYNKAALMLIKEDESETKYLDEKQKVLNELLETGIYGNSVLARTYKDVLEIYKRLLFIMTRYTSLADEKMGEVKKIVSKHYSLKEKFPKVETPKKGIKITVPKLEKEDGKTTN